MVGPPVSLVCRILPPSCDHLHHPCLSFYLHILPRTSTPLHHSNLVRSPTHSPTYVESRVCPRQISKQGKPLQKNFFFVGGVGPVCRSLQNLPPTRISSYTFNFTTSTKLSQNSQILNTNILCNMLYSSLALLFAFATKPFLFLPAPYLQSPQSVWLCRHKSSHSSTPPKQQPIPYPKPPTREIWITHSRFPTHHPSKTIHPSIHSSKPTVIQRRQLSRVGCESGQDH